MSQAGTPILGARRRSLDADPLDLADGPESAGAGTLYELFGLPSSEALIEDFACAISKAILLQGRMYITQDHVCFHSSIFGHRTCLCVLFADIASLRKVTHALINPGIEFTTTRGETFSFASFFFRDHTFKILKELHKFQHRHQQHHHHHRLLATPPREPASGCDSPARDSTLRAPHELAGAPPPPSRRTTPFVRATADADVVVVVVGAPLSSESSGACARSPSQQAPSQQSPSALRQQQSTSSGGSGATTSSGGHAHDDDDDDDDDDDGDGDEGDDEQEYADTLVARTSLDQGAGQGGRGAGAQSALAGAMRASAVPDIARALRQICADAGAPELARDAASMREPLAHVTVTQLPLELSVVDFWLLFASDASAFLRHYRLATGAQELAVDPWRPFAAGGCVRESRFIQPIRSMLSPVRRTRVLETQRCCWLQADTSKATEVHADDAPAAAPAAEPATGAPAVEAAPAGAPAASGAMSMVSCITCSLVLQFSQVFVDTPYGDYFTVEHKWLVEPARGECGAEACAVSASVQVSFQKQTWLRAKIVQGCVDENTEYYATFMRMLSSAVHDQQAANLAASPSHSPAKARAQTDEASRRSSRRSQRATAAALAASEQSDKSERGDTADKGTATAAADAADAADAGEAAGAGKAVEGGGVASEDAVFENQFWRPAVGAHAQAAWAPCAHNAGGSGRERPPFLSDDGRCAWTRLSDVLLPQDQRQTQTQQPPGEPTDASEPPSELGLWRWTCDWQLAAAAHAAEPGQPAASDGGDGGDGGGCWRYAQSWRGPWATQANEHSAVRRRRWVRRRAFTPGAHGTLWERLAWRGAAWMQRTTNAGADEGGALGGRRSVAAATSECVRLGARLLGRWVSAQAPVALCCASFLLGLWLCPYLAGLGRSADYALTGALGGRAGAPAWPSQPAPAELSVLAALADGAGASGGQVARWLRRVGVEGESAQADAAALALAAECLRRIGALQLQLAAEVDELGRVVRLV